MDFLSVLKKLIPGHILGQFNPCRIGNRLVHQNIVAVYSCRNRHNLASGRTAEGILHHLVECTHIQNVLAVQCHKGIGEGVCKLHGCRGLNLHDIRLGAAS